VQNNRIFAVRAIHTPPRRRRTHPRTHTDMKTRTRDRRPLHLPANSHRERPFMTMADDVLAPPQAA